MQYHFEYFDSNYLYRRDKWHKYEEDKAILSSDVLIAHPPPPEANGKRIFRK